MASAKRAQAHGRTGPGAPPAGPTARRTSTAPAKPAAGFPAHAAGGPNPVKDLAPNVICTRRPMPRKQLGRPLSRFEEYGRHTGHADLLREAVDGRVGEDPPARWSPKAGHYRTG